MPNHPAPLYSFEAVASRVRRDTFTHAKIEGAIMLYTLAVILIVLWLLGMVSAYTIGGFIHVLLVIAVIVILVRLISGRNVL
jgi:asparagine N-glycosylation enzyme membrane subunit Stt3